MALATMSWLMMGEIKQDISLPTIWEGKMGQIWNIFWIPMKLELK